jgi:hypothetical protein
MFNGFGVGESLITKKVLEAGHIFSNYKFGEMSSTVEIFLSNANNSEKY